MSSFLWNGRLPSKIPCFVPVLEGVESMTPLSGFCGSSISLQGNSDIKEPFQIGSLVHTPKVDCLSLGALVCEFVSSIGL